MREFIYSFPTKYLFCFLFFFISIHLAAIAQEENPIYGIGFCTSGTYTIHIKTPARQRDINSANLSLPDACDLSRQLHTPFLEDEMIYYTNKEIIQPKFQKQPDEDFIFLNK